MPIDSTAELLFRVGADPTDAQANLQRFRSLLGKDLAGMKTEFSDWANSVFGDLSTVRGGLIAAGAAAAASIVGIGAALTSAVNKAAQYAEEIEDGMDKTGLSAEEMSKLRFAAERTGAGYDKLVQSLVIFQSNLVKAAAGEEQAARSFRWLGISQAEVQAGTENLGPLLMRVSDAYKGLASSVEKAAIAREQFGRGGADMVEFLGLGSEAIRQFGERAQELGRVLREEDVVAAKAFQMANQELKAEMEGLAYTVGNSWMPVMQKWAAFKIAAAETLRKDTGGPIAEIKAWAGFLGEYEKAQERLAAALQAAVGAAGSGRLDLSAGAAGAKETAREYYGLSTILDGLRRKTAELGSEEARVTQEVAQYGQQVARAAGELEKLRAEHAITAASAEREARALAEMPAAIEAWAAAERQKILDQRNRVMLAAERDLQGRLEEMGEQTLERRLDAWERETQSLIDRLAEEGTLNQATADLVAEIWQRGGEQIGHEYNEAILAARRDLDRQLLGLEQQTFARQHEAWDAEMDERLRRMQQAHQDTAEAVQRLAEVRRAGHAKIRGEQTEAFQGELAGLQRHLAQILQARMTTSERIAFLYEQDMARYSEPAEAEALETAATPGERAVVEEQYARNRQALLDEYNAGMQALYNSQGWQGVWGAEFAQTLGGNEALLREWAESTDQAMLMVRVAAESLGDMSRRAFHQFAQGMGQSIAQAIIYKKSVREAMQEALAATLAGLSAESLAYSVYSLGLGFLRLAQHQYPAASKAFTAAALFGSVGAAVAVAGRALAPQQEQEGRSGTGIESAGGASASDGESPAEGRGARVQVIVQGHLVGSSGVEELAEIINDAVENRDVRLVATTTRRGGRATQ